MKFALQHMLRRANADERNGQLLKAIQLYRIILERFPKNIQARQSVIRLLPLVPNAPKAPPRETLKALGALYEENRAQELLDRTAGLVLAYPRSVHLWNLLGAANARLEYLPAAERCYRQALALAPDFPNAHANLGNALRRMNRLSEAAESYTRALALRPDHNIARGNRALIKQKMCDWTNIEDFEFIKDTIGSDSNFYSSLNILALEDEPARHRQRAETHAERNFARSPLPFAPRPAGRPNKLRLGYFSGDFKIHPLMYLTAGLFEAHDRDRFEVIGFSSGPDSDDEMRLRARAAFDRFIDVNHLDDVALVELARQYHIDIAIDCSGYTNFSRIDALAYRAAPVQINYLGYPGTLGADFIDYIVADEVLVPKSSQHYYSENLIYMPYTYMPIDDSRQISDREMTRAEFGLPDGAFVFCCFNNSYKILPSEFDIWMQLLRKVPGSVLWLYRSNQFMEGNLRGEAEARGIDTDRLVFAERLPQAEHLARHQLADLFLDTFHYNAHTTASDALWAGLPVITKVGEGFSARVAASLLSAAGLPELITYNAQEYEARALELATNADQLSLIKRKLAQNRMTEPLFNTKLYTRHLEQAFEKAYQRYLDRKSPDTIYVQP